MAGFWSRLYARLSQRGKRSGTQRRLRVEALENRQLMANDLAAITGTVFTDLTGDGLTGDDLRVNGATVRLFRDGGNGTYDNGGGDDTLVTTTTSNGSGVYRFDRVEAATYFVQQQPVVGLVQSSGASVSTVTVSALQARGTAGATIDSFNTTVQNVSAGALGADANSAAAVEAIGGERDLRVTNTTAGGTIILSANSSTAGTLEYTATSAATGVRQITWDGVDGSSTLAATGLGGLDITNGGTNVAFRFTVGADQNNGEITVRVYTNGTDFSTATVAIPNTGGTPTAVVTLRYADFAIGGGLGANFANVGAIEMDIAGSAAVDGQLDLMETASVISQSANFQNFQPLSLGNLIFRDLNNNGTADGGESGLNNVTVQLYADTNANGSFDTGTDVFQTSTTSDINGNYLFTGLLPGDYIVVIPVSQFGAGQALFGLATSTGNDPAPDPDNNTNGDDNGSALLLVGVVSQAITLATNAEPTGDGDGDANTNLTMDFGFVPVVDLQVTKSDAPDPVVAGNQLTYTVTVTNAGPSNATNVVLTDSLPAGVTFVSVSASQGSASNSAGTITANLGTIAAAGNATVTIVVSVPASTAAATVLNNTASVTSSELESDSSNNSATAATTVNRLVNVGITKTDSPDPVTVNGNITYTLTVTNTGPSDASGVTITDILSSDLTFVSSSQSQGSSSNVAGTVSVVLGNIAAGASATATIIATASGTSVTSIPNTATVISTETDSDNTNNSATTSTAVNQQIDLAVVKTESVDPVIAGNPLTYTLTVTNNGPSTATNVVLTDVLPAQLTFTSANASQGSVANAAGTVTANLGNLASGASATVTIVTGVIATASGTINNTATVTATQTDTNATNNSDTEATVVNRNVDMQITKTDGVATVIAGQTLAYTITVTNAGPSQATGVTVTDALPASLSFVSATASQGTTSATGQNFTATVGTLNPGASATITVNVNVRSNATGVISNTSTVTATETEVNNANNSATDTTTANRQVDISVTKTDSPDPVVAGNQLTYTMLVTNAGPSDASGVTLTDVLPAGVSFVSATSTVGTATNAAGTVTGTIGNLASGASATVTIVVGVNAATRGAIPNTATVTSVETDSNNANNSASASTTANGQVDLAITKTDNADPVAPGATLTYTITVTNNGPSTATNVVVTDVLPTQLVFATATASQGTATNAAGTVTGNLGTLAPGASATITINTTVPTNLVQTAITNTSTVTATETELNANNNSASQGTVIAARGSLAGFVYIDINRNGVRDGGDTGIAGVLIALNGTDFLGAPVALTETTNATGDYLFANLLPGTYTVTQTQPTGFQDSDDNFGQGVTGTAANDSFTVNFTGAPTATNFNFGEVRSFSKRRFLSTPTA